MCLGTQEPVRTLEDLDRQENTSMDDPNLGEQHGGVEKAYALNSAQSSGLAPQLASCVASSSEHRASLQKYLAYRKCPRDSSFHGILTSTLSSSGPHVGLGEVPSLFRPCPQP